MGNIHRPTVSKGWNHKLDKTTWRIGKAGVRNQFLLFGNEEIDELYALLTEAIKGRNGQRG